MLNNQEILLDLGDFALQEQSEVNLMVFISRVWYHNSYTMASKPIKSLELRYTVIQLLIKIINNTKLSFARLISDKLKSLKKVSKRQNKNTH